MARSRTSRSPTISACLTKPSVSKVLKKLLLIVDNWERLERLEHALASVFEVHCAGFGPEGIALARELKPDAIYIDLTFENMTEEEARNALASEDLGDALVFGRRASVDEVVAELLANS